MLQVSAKRFWTVTIVGSIIGFTLFCGIDYYLVRCVPYPDHIHDLDWTAVAFPLVHLVGAFVSCQRDVLAAIMSSILASVVALVLIFMIGFQFHFAIGGSL